MKNERKLDPALQSMLIGLATSKPSDVDVRQEARDQKIEALRASYQRMHANDPSPFRPGDLVRWKPSMKYVKWPQYGEAAVVVECVDPPVMDDEQDSGSTYFRMPMTLVLGMNHDGGFHCWHFDGRRFELAT